MSQIFKKMAAGVTLLMLPFTMASAYYDCNPCCMPSFNVGVDFLYWKPCVDDLAYANLGTLDEENVKFQYKNISQNWAPGVRVFASMPNCFCCWDAGFSFTYLKTSNSNCCSIPFEDLSFLSAFSSPLVHPFIVAESECAGEYDRVKGSYETKYFNPDLLFSYHLCKGPCLQVSPYFGVAALYLKQELSFEGFNSEFSEKVFCNAVEWENDSWGLGLKFGCAVEQKLFCCLDFFANGSFSLLAGKSSKATNTQLYNEPLLEEAVEEGDELERRMSDYELTTYKFIDPSCCRCLPGYHIQAGVKYAATLCGCNWGLRLGYEFVNWHHVPNPRIFFTERLDDFTLGQSSSPNTRTFGFHGLFLGLEAGF